MANGESSRASDGPGSRSRTTAPWLHRTTTALVVLVLLAAAASYQFDLGEHWLGWNRPSPVTEPAEVEPPPGLSLPAPRAAAVVADEVADRDADPAKVRRAVARLAANKKLGRRVTIAVDQLSDGSSVYRSGPRIVTPASTMKMLTTTAALEALGPERRFTTKVMARPSSRSIVLVGGGDPLLARAPDRSSELYPRRADLQTLARSTAEELKASGRTRVRLRYDTSLFRGPSVSPEWPASYIRESVVSPISPLWMDEGRDRTGLAFRSPDPAAAAADAFAKALARNKVAVVGRPKPGTVPRGGAEVASVESAPLVEVVQHVLEASDNEAAEVLARQVAIAEGRPASFQGGATAVREVLTDLGIDLSRARILDGSGLSRHDRLDPDSLLSVLETASSEDHPGLRGVVTGLPVAGFSGSLTYRFQTGDRRGLGMVRAKTGTLTGVHGLTGVVTTADGVVVTFAAIADRVRLKNTLAARDKLDEIAAALAGCSCASPATP